MGKKIRRPHHPGKGNGAGGPILDSQTSPSRKPTTGSNNTPLGDKNQIAPPGKVAILRRANDSAPRPYQNLRPQGPHGLGYKARENKEEAPEEESELKIQYLIKRDLKDPRAHAKPFVFTEGMKQIAREP